MTPEQTENERTAFQSWLRGYAKPGHAAAQWEAWQARAELDRLPPLVEIPMHERPASEWPVVSLDGEKLKLADLPEESP